jgi:hypothetical protein
MGSNFTNLVVTWYDESDGYATSAAISSDVLAIPLFTDTGSGEVNEAELVLSAKAGNYISSGNIIDKYDRIHISIRDLALTTYSRYFEVTDIIPTQSKTEGSVLTLRCVGIEYHTQVVHYARRDWFRNAFYVADKIGDAYESNHGSRQPTLQRHDTAYSTTPAYGNDLPNWTNNHYEFGANEDSCYNRWMDLTTLLGGAVTNGGVGDFFELGFDTPSVNVIDLALFTSGKREWDGNNPTNDALGIVVENTTAINVSEQEGGISNPTGTKSAAWGSPIHGSLPVGFSKYAGGELEFSFRPQWTTGIVYKVGAKVLGTSNRHFECILEHTSNSLTKPSTGAISLTYWSIIDMGDEFGDSIQYSPWTDDKAVLWGNAGADPDGVSSIPAWTTVPSTAYNIGDLVTNGGNQYVCTDNHTTTGSSNFANDLARSPIPRWEIVDNAQLGNGAAFFDQNMIIRDDGVMFRTWVNEVIGDTDYDTINDASLSTEYQHSDLLHRPIGHRVLNVSNTQLSGNDNRGKSFTDAVAQWANNRAPVDNGQWEVLYEQPDEKLDRMQVFDIKDKKMWEWNDTTNQWSDVTTTTQLITNDFYGLAGLNMTTQNDECAHQWKSLYNIQGSNPRPTRQSTTPFNEDANDYAKNIRSAVEVCYEFTNAGGDFVSSSADAKKGAWLNFGFPFPVSTYGGIGEGVGDIYGGGTNENTSTGITEPSLLDTQNMSATPTGLYGFNQADSESLGPLSSLSCNMRVTIDDYLGNKLGGTAQVRCFMVDTKDNIVTQDFEFRFTDKLGTGKGFETVNLPLSGFSSFRGRVPKTWTLRWADTIFGIEIPIQELDVQDVFNEHSIKYIGFQINDFYDDEGRFDPQRNLQDTDGGTGTMAAGGGTIRLAIDAFHFKKVLLAISGTQSVQNIEPLFLQRPNILSYNQLKNEVNSQLEIEQFRHKEYNYQTSGNSIFDIRFGDTHFLKNTDLISDADYTETSLGAGDGTAGTVRLVAKRVEYHLTKPTNGPGGITRSIKGVKRFTV